MAAVLAVLGFSDDPEMEATATRFLEFLAELDPRRPPPVMAPMATSSTDPLVLRGVPFYSLCAHHLVPFFGSADIAIRPAGQLCGLGSIARQLQHFARRPQVQERLGAMLAEQLQQALNASCVLVRLRARHLCMEMRGAQTCAEVETLARRGNADGELLTLLGPTTAEPERSEE